MIEILFRCSLALPQHYSAGAGRCCRTLRPGNWATVAIFHVVFPSPRPADRSAIIYIFST